jgi:hypothetical protein
MSDLSPLLGEERKSNFGVVRSVGTQLGHREVGSLHSKFDAPRSFRVLILPVRSSVPTPWGMGLGDGHGSPGKRFCLAR